MGWTNNEPKESFGPIFGLMLVPVSACPQPLRNGQALAHADPQFWPEVNLSLKLDRRVSILPFGTLHFGKEVSDPDEEHIGVGLNFSPGKYTSLGRAHRYITGQPPGRSHVREHRFFLDFAARLPLRDGFLLSESNRGELRRINGVNSGHYRSRLQLERPL